MGGIADPKRLDICKMDWFEIKNVIPLIGHVSVLICFYSNGNLLFHLNFEIPFALADQVDKENSCNIVATMAILMQLARFTFDYTFKLEALTNEIIVLCSRAISVRIEQSSCHFQICPWNRLFFRMHESQSYVIIQFVCINFLVIFSTVLCKSRALMCHQNDPWWMRNNDDNTFKMWIFPWRAPLFCAATNCATSSPLNHRSLWFH